jgi:hypothetical protein
MRSDGGMKGMINLLGNFVILLDTEDNQIIMEILFKRGYTGFYQVYF